MIAIVDGDSWLGTPSELTQRYKIQIFSASGDLASGNTPALPHAVCAIRAPDGSVASSDAGSDSLFDSLSFSPDGSSPAYAYNRPICVAHLTSLAAREEATVTQVIAVAAIQTGGRPNVNPSPRPAALSPRGASLFEATHRQTDRQPDVAVRRSELGVEACFVMHQYAKTHCGVRTEALRQCQARARTARRLSSKGEGDLSSQDRADQVLED